MNAVERLLDDAAICFERALQEESVSRRLEWLDLGNMWLKLARERLTDRGMRVPDAFVRRH